MTKTVDPILLEILWTRMVSIADEIGATIADAGFSTVLRENHDYSCAVFDTKGKMLAQASQSATGHIGAMPYLAKEFLKRFPLESLKEGDLLITNDPWIGCGHLNDVYIGGPIFRKGRMVGMIFTSAHQMDIGGRLASPESRSVYEEGIMIPPLKLYRAGEPNQDVWDIIRSNVRFSDKVIGDLRAQVAATYVGCQRVLEAMDEYGLEELETIAEAIITQTEVRMRKAIEELPDGVYLSEGNLEMTDGNDNPIMVKAKVIIEGDHIIVDYTGTSPEVQKPVNCVLNYCRTYTVIGIKLAIAPFLPNNEGSYRPIEIRAPEGSVLNTKYPAACYNRHFIGLRLPDVLFKALVQCAPEKVIAGSGSCPVWLYTVSGQRSGGQPFLLNSHAFGGLGARPDQDGVSTVAFPPNIYDIQAEIVENETPLLVEYRRYRADSGGAGTFRGGLGEEVRISAWAKGDLRPNWAVDVAVVPGRYIEPANGVQGGLPGAIGEVHVNDKNVASTIGREQMLKAGGTLTYLTPGGGGYGDPRLRSPDAVKEDVRLGFVSAEAALAVYGVTVDAVSSQDGRVLKAVVAD
jgi:N-methylhydantoinase B